MALGLSLMWGYAGMFSSARRHSSAWRLQLRRDRDQSGASGRSPCCALRAASRWRRCSPLLLGYFMIYGRVSGVFFGIVTFSATLVLAPSSARRPVRNGRSARRGCNGFNGMTGMPPLDCRGSADRHHVFEGTRSTTSFWCCWW